MSFLYKIARNRLYPPADPTTSFAEKTVLLTGANIGLGLEAAIKFVTLGVETLIIGVRNLEKGNAAKEAIEARTGRHGVVKVWQLDMNSYGSVKAFAERIDREVERLDIAELNAGLLNRTYVKSREGWEEALQVNVLSTVLLGLLLLPKLKASKIASSTAHLSFVSSGTHRIVRPERVVGVEGNLLEHFNDEKNFGSGQVQYGVTKLFLEYAKREIAALTRQSNGELEVIVNSLCPGFCTSSLSRGFSESGFLWSILVTVYYGIFARTTEQGSRSLVSGPTRGEESHGMFWKDDEYPE